MLGNLSTRRKIELSLEDTVENETPESLLG